MGNRVRNISAIAGKEMRVYFGSPIAWVMMGLFALIFGYFYVAYVDLVASAAMRAQFGGGPVKQNVNNDLIRPLLQNASVIILFLVPMVTMRTYSEEKRSGTIELLLTSPVSDTQIILGKFLGAMTLYTALLAVTLIHIGVLFIYGTPEWKPIVTAYLGLLLMGGCFISLGLFISSLTKNQIVAGMITFAVFLMLWVVNWLGSFVGPTAQAVLAHLSITDHFDDFAKGIIDTKHLVYYVSFIAFGLFLTAKSVDSERWRG